MLCCLGDLVEDVVVRLGGEVAVGTDTDVGIVRRRGGSAANVAVSAAQRIRPVRYVGCVGVDGVGDWLIAELDRSGVDAVVQRRGRTGTIVVLVDATGERSMLRDRAAAGELDVLPEGAMDGVSWLHIPAYSLAEEPVARVAIEAVNTVRTRDATVSVDASSVAVIAGMADPSLQDLIHRLEPDVLLCNADEAALLLGDDERGVPGARLTIVKAGPSPARAFDAGGVVATVPAVALPSDLDTTGAGDAFAGGFIAARLDGLDIQASLIAGHEQAAVTMKSNARL